MIRLAFLLAADGCRSGGPAAPLRRYPGCQYQNRVSGRCRAVMMMGTCGQPRHSAVLMDAVLAALGHVQQTVDVFAILPALINH